MLRATVTGAATAAGLPVALSEGGRAHGPAPGAAVVVKLGAGVQILGRGRMPETLADLAVGDRVTLVIEAPAGASPLDFPAVAIKDGGPPRPVRFTVRGIVAADATPAGLQVGVSVANSQANAALGATGTVLVDDRAGHPDPQARRGARRATRDLKAGDRVTVAWWAPRGTALAGAARRPPDHRSGAGAPVGAWEPGLSGVGRAPRRGGGRPLPRGGRPPPRACGRRAQRRVMIGIAQSPASTARPGTSQATRSNPDFGGVARTLDPNSRTRPSMTCCSLQPPALCTAM